ncbi:hypothetical protein RBB50_012114 [Rhinocladiella similis]
MSRTSPAPSAPPRPIRTCQPCRLLKLRCNRGKPACSRCISAGRACHYSSQASQESTPVAVQLKESALGYAACDESESAGVSDPPTLGEIQNKLRSLTSRRSDSEEPDFGDHLPRINRANQPQKRIRPVLSCSRCRKLKAKCDRQYPCGRCCKYGQQCTYPPVRPPDKAHGAGKMQASDSKGDFGRARDLWEAKHCAANHWMSLFQYARNLLTNQGGHFDHDAEERPFQSLTSPNYPFVESSGGGDLPKSMPQRPIIQLLVQRYFDTIGKMFRIIDMAAFEAELQCYWEKSDDASPGWMARLLLLMSLGCDSLNRVDMHFASTHEHLPNLFLDQGAALLHQTPFMFRPDVCTIQTLCLMVLAKQMVRKSCFEEDASWCLTGMIKRLAISINLHLDQPTITSTDHESGLRRGLWMTILYLDLRQSVLSGLPVPAGPLPTSSAQSCCLGCVNASPSQLSTSTLQITPHASHREATRTILSGVLPLAYEVALAARSIDFPYETAVRLDKEVRRVSRELKELSAESASSASVCRDDFSVSQWEAIYLDTLFRRLLLELHRRFAYEPQAAIHYPVSHWSTLDCAAAMLVLQRSVYEKAESTTDQWLIEIFHSDFFVAGLTVSLYLLQNSPQIDSSTLPVGYALTTLLETLRSCRDIWARGKKFWLCEYMKFQFFDQVIESLDRGTV